MKDGKKAKSKTVKKASGAKSGKGASKKGLAATASSSKAVAKAGEKGSSKGVTAKSSAVEKGGGKAAGRAPAKGSGAAREAEGGFSNAAVAAAFKRAVKKYPSALKRLSD